VQEQGADWGVVAFVTKYPTYWGGYASTPKIVMRWKAGNDNFDRVLAHETGHTFGAPDEYAASKCDCAKTYGRFFTAKNGNCALCASKLTMAEEYPKTIANNWHGLPPEFEAGIDAAVFRDVNQRVYMFKGDQYIRMTNTTVDAGYPEPIAGNWHGLPASFEQGIDAALFRKSNGKLYFFKGNQYVRLTGSTVDPGYPKHIASNWHGLPASFEASIDAALWRPSNQKTYFFKGGQYVRLTETTVDRGYPKPIADNWHGLPPEFEAGIDAAFWRKSNGKIYLFKDNQYVRLTETTVDRGYPKPIADKWEGLPTSFQQKIDAAMMRLDTNQIYMFSARRYVRYSNVSNGIDPGYPNWVDKNWMPFPRG
jgi:Hemopexin